MLHLPLSLMNRLNKTESAIFDLIFGLNLPKCLVFDPQKRHNVNFLSHDGADVVRDHHLLVARFTLKLEKSWTGVQPKRALQHCYDRRHLEAKLFQVLDDLRKNVAEFERRIDFNEQR
ncbi:hypothetical protein DPMN_098320 [Dreissena polymorpha]|uniref:Uncharacterized protein n=1 Tax=Dreissena polymorpha TaxID=45954 RepID=A0A9D4R5D5_DREPO|nr:hypothetical protein DPMN_098320 [Dreissena polymorpha]